MRNSSHKIERSEARLEALLHAFVLAVFAVGILMGLALARLADWGGAP
jgi:hypothetical protein